MSKPEPNFSCRLVVFTCIIRFLSPNRIYYSVVIIYPDGNSPTSIRRSILQWKWSGLGMTIAMGRVWILSGIICTFASTTHFYICTYMNILADHAEPCSAPVPRQHWAAEKQTWKLSPSFSPLPTYVMSARKQPSSPDIMVGRAACAFALRPFLLCLEHDNGWVHSRTLLIPTNTSK